MTRKYTLKQARVINNFKQNDVAEILGITSETISRWENGKSFPDVKILKEMLELYHIEFNDLIFLGIDYGLTETKGER